MAVFEALPSSTNRELYKKQINSNSDMALYYMPQYNNSCLKNEVSIVQTITHLCQLFGRQYKLRTVKR